MTRPIERMAVRSQTEWRGRQRLVGVWKLCGDGETQTAAGWMGKTWQEPLEYR